MGTSRRRWSCAAVLQAELPVEEVPYTLSDLLDIYSITPAELKTATPSGGFDVALSISSFDHDGLGRYGDPLEPDNDLRAMRVATDMWRCHM